MPPARYATGVFSSRKLEQATYGGVRFRYTRGGEHPSELSQAVSDELEGLFKQILVLAGPGSAADG